MPAFTERSARRQSGNTVIHWLAGHCAAMFREAQASIAELSRELGINPKTVAKWRKRQSVEDQKTGPKDPRSTVLSEEEEGMIVAFRRHTLLPLDDCLYALQPSIPHPLTVRVFAQQISREVDAILIASLPSAARYLSARALDLAQPYSGIL